MSLKHEELKEGDKIVCVHAQKSMKKEIAVGKIYEIMKVGLDYFIFNCDLNERRYVSLEQYHFFTKQEEIKTDIMSITKAFLGR